MLTSVTITGADDGVDPQALADLSVRFPFVEWGVLLTPKLEGTPRYPSRAWRDRLASLGLRASVHLCGTVARDAMAGSTRDEPITRDAQRIQINGFLPALATRMAYVTAEWILQARSESEIQPAADFAKRLPHASPSGGRGIEAFRWPPPPLGTRMGYAGGIKPSTIEDVLRDIGPVDAPFWLDMESGVRTGDRFDLSLARAALEAAEPYIVSTDGGAV